MRYNEIIDLLTVTYTTDPLGNQIETETPRTIFANEFGVSSSEFYDAAAQGLKAEKQFEIYSFEYQNETKLTHEGEEYRIIRTQKNGEKMRLTCEKVLADG